MGIEAIQAREAAHFLPVVNRLPVALVEGAARACATPTDASTSTSPPAGASAASATATRSSSRRSASRPGG